MFFRLGGFLADFIPRHRLLWLILVGVFFVGVDQASKRWAQAHLSVPVHIGSRIYHVPASSVEVVPHFLRLIYKENPAAAFSLTSSLPDWFRRPFLLVISLIATLFFAVWYFRLKQARALLLSAFCLIMAGAVGNLLDRWRLGYVIDFLDVYAGFLGWPFAHWPTFNVADSCIVVGAFFVILHSFLWPSPVKDGVQEG